MRQGHGSLTIVGIYLLAHLAALLFQVKLIFNNQLPPWLLDHELFYQCVLAGGFGGITYLLRAVYLNACVLKQWDSSWVPWYLFRPFTSMLSGGISYIFMRAGLVVLDAQTQPDSVEYGFFALALIAGLNVDRFLNKIEDIGHAVWGIRKSRSSETSDNDAYKGSS